MAENNLDRRCARSKGARVVRGRFTSARCGKLARAGLPRLRARPVRGSSHNTSSAQLRAIWPRWWSHAATEARVRGPRLDTAAIPKRSRQSDRSCRATDSLGPRGPRGPHVEDLRRRAGETTARHGDRQRARARARASARTYATGSSSSPWGVSALRMGGAAGVERAVSALREVAPCV